jgi:beta-hydroxylase
VAPLNIPIYPHSAAPRTPLQDIGQLPELQRLRENWQVIRNEALALRSEQRISTAAERTDLAFYSFFKRGWKRFYLKWYDDYLPSAQAHCPQTVALVQRCPSVKAASSHRWSRGPNCPITAPPLRAPCAITWGSSPPTPRTARFRSTESPIIGATAKTCCSTRRTAIARRITAVSRGSFSSAMWNVRWEPPLRTGWARAYNRFVGRYVAAATASCNEGG